MVERKDKNMSQVQWIKYPNSPDYQTSDGKYIAKYINTCRGFGNYWVFHSTEKKQTLKNALVVGGLPEKMRF